MHAAKRHTAGDFTLYGISSGSKGISRARRRMGAVVETPSIYLDMTADENLRQQYRVLGLPSWNGIAELIHLLGLFPVFSAIALNCSNRAFSAVASLLLEIALCFGE